jgi:hypothetical protein
LESLNYVGGIIVRDFILGFNFIKERFITDVSEMTEQGVVQLKTPLLKTKMYSRFVYSGKKPMVIKSATFFNTLTSEFNEYFFGKFSNQVSFATLVYGLSQTAAKSTTVFTPEIFTNTYVGVYGDIKINYFYYNGIEWLEDVEIIGGSGIENYTTYTDNLGYKFFQHTIEEPYILIPYLGSYVNSIKNAFNCEDTELGAESLGAESLGAESLGAESLGAESLASTRTPMMAAASLPLLRAPIVQLTKPMAMYYN